RTAVRARRTPDQVIARLRSLAVREARLPGLRNETVLLNEEDGGGPPSGSCARAQTFDLALPGPPRPRKQLLRCRPGPSRSIPCPLVSWIWRMPVPVAIAPEPGRPHTPNAGARSAQFE